MSTPIQSLKLLSLLQLTTAGFFSALITYFWGIQLGASFLMGSALMVVNVLLLAWTWWRILTQKRIAWTLLVIVIKYAVLLGTIYYFTRAGWFNSLGFGLGIVSFVVAALGLGLLLEKLEKEI
jgi:hypothetical protein